MMASALPIDSFLGEIAGHFGQHQNLIVRASPGSGKTTRVPPCLLSHTSGKILVLEPRRVAARMAAQRVAQEMGVDLGGVVGYHFRQERKMSSATRLLFLTEGLLIRYLLSDPSLRGVSTVILDEFHERHLHSDVALAVLRRLQRERRPDLKIVVMSATLEISRLQNFLGGAPVLDFTAPRYPVEITHLKQDRALPLAQAVAEAVEQFLSVSGDILIFLPGRREIQQACDELAERRLPFLVMPLYGELPVADQVRALQPIAGQRRVVVATNLAESSLTIEGVTTVIDSGLHRQARMSPWSGATLLETRPICRASAIQRAGRAGRQGPGRCWRLYTESDLAARLEFDVPEIHRAELSHTALEVIALSEGEARAEVGELEWFEAPRAGAWEAALTLLQQLAAIRAHRLTDVGRWMAQVPLAPRLARCLLEGMRLGVVAELLPLLANLSEGDVKTLDICDATALRTPQAQRLADGLRAMMEPMSDSQLQRLGVTQKIAERPAATEDKLRKAFLAGFPDRVGSVRRRGPQWVEVTLAQSGAVEVDRLNSFWDTQDPQYLLVLEAHEQKLNNRVIARAQVISSLQVDWLLTSPLVREESSLRWDGRRIRVSSALLYQDLCLIEDLSAPPTELNAAAPDFWLREVFGITVEDEIPRLLDKLEPFVERTRVAEALARWKLACEHKIVGESGQKLLSQGRWLRAVLTGIWDVDALAQVDWLSSWLQVCAAGAPEATLRRRLDELLPEIIVLGPRAKVRVHYEWERSPWVAARIQDFFGKKQGPTILDGKQSLLLHLLAPNHRAVQVTQDLAGFWVRHYPELSRQLRRRYPRHYWPDDPINCLPPPAKK